MADLLAQAYADEIKEFHFHVYYFQNAKWTNSGYRDHAMKLRDQIQQLIDAGFFQVRISRAFDEPAGPHPMPMFEVWCPKESFSRLYSWFILNRGPLNILIHPLTKEEGKDHTERAVFMGMPVPLDPAILRNQIDKTPMEHTELGLGYSAPAEK